MEMKYLVQGGGEKGHIFVSHFVRIGKKSGTLIKFIALHLKVFQMQKQITRKRQVVKILIKIIFF